MRNRVHKNIDLGRLKTRDLKYYNLQKQDTKNSANSRYNLPSDSWIAAIILMLSNVVVLYVQSLWCSYRLLIAVAQFKLAHDKTITTVIWDPIYDGNSCENFTAGDRARSLVSTSWRHMVKKECLLHMLKIFTVISGLSFWYRSVPEVLLQIVNSNFKLYSIFFH